MGQPAITGTSKRGFASLTLERRREVSRLGGVTAHALGRAHKWTTEQAREAGRIGGRISKRKSKKGQNA